MTRLSIAVLLALVASPPAPGHAQSPLRVAAGVGPYRVDDVAGTPLVPMVGLFKPVGRQAVIGANLGLVKSAGFYGLDALTLDAHLGVEKTSRRLTLTGTLGPSAMAGGDGDGTPYLSAGAHATAGLTWWFTDRVGLWAATTGRLWFTTGNSRFSPGAMVGLSFRGARSGRT
ncbi:MAG: hypothetical protein FJ206_17260 [Gemmatimonadetes bacterium]|nr:hypothetical protein [Gemmatimonadota bacterium]